MSLQSICPLFRAPTPLCVSGTDATTAPESEESMISKAEARELVTDLFEEEALVIGGLVALHQVDDDLVWELIKHLDLIRTKILNRLDDEDPPDDHGAPLHGSSIEPHPAIERFLHSLRRT